MDIKMYTGTLPPCLVPISERAIAFMRIPEGVDGVIILEEASRVLAAFPEDYSFTSTHQPPAKIALVGADLLHQDGNTAIISP